MIVEPIHELMIIGIADPGVPNQERIIIRPTQAVNLAGFGVYLGVMSNGLFVPIRDHYFWLGEIIITPPSWIFVYTGSGQYQQTQVPTTGETAHTFHWGKQFTVFQQRGLVPALFRIDGITVGAPVPDGQIPPASTP